MFDIFMAQADGKGQHLASVRCLTQAQEMARQLSGLIPGEYFCYFERSQDVDVADLFSAFGSRVVNASNNSVQRRLRDERVAN